MRNISNHKVLIYRSELDYLSKCILESPNTETGGNMFGLMTPFGIPFIQYVVGPGPHAQHHVDHFRQDFDFLEKNADFLVAEHALHHIGSWHSHHSLGLTVPSGGDSKSTIDGIHECGLEQFVLVIGNIERGRSSVRPYLYEANGNCELLQWVILPNDSPIRLLYDQRHADIVYQPKGQANMNLLDTANLTGNLKLTPSIDYPERYWLADKENRKLFPEIVKILNIYFDSVKIFQQEDKTIEIQLVKGVQIIKIHFDKNFPVESPKLYVIKGSQVQLDPTFEWDYSKTNSILSSMYNLINSILL